MVLGLNAGNVLSLDLWPEWSAQWHRTAFPTNSQGQVLSVGGYEFIPQGFYFMHDMQHVYKEVLLYFHAATPSNQDMIELTKTFAFHPVPTLATSWA